VGLEIERKFLVHTGLLPDLGDGTYIKQGYIDTGSMVSVRSRIKGSQGFLTLKGASTDDGLSRSEFEYEIPLEDAHQIIDELCRAGTIEKTRYEIVSQNMTWELDVFSGANSGLVMVEIEVPEVSTKIVRPEWVGRELTGDVRYYNMNLATNPWPNWNG
jgi:adenylate cyclase